MRTILTLLLATFAASAQQAPTADDPQPVPPPNRPAQPGPPMFLDRDHDGEISEEEITQAPGSLRKLDQNGDGWLSPIEMLRVGPPVPPRGGQPGSPVPRQPQPEGDSLQ